MAIDPRQLMMMLQGGGGAPEPPATSGLPTPVSLSGGPLGEMGMGGAGGGSLLGGGAGGGTGGAGGGPGLDFFNLMASLQGEPGAVAPGFLGQLGGGGTLGQSFGAGGELQPAVVGGTRGGGALGGGMDTLAFLSKFGKQLQGILAGPGEVQGPPVTAGQFPQDPLLPFLSGGLDRGMIGGTSGGSVPALPFDPSQTTPFQIDPSIVSGASGGGFVPGAAGAVEAAPQTGAEIAAQLGAQGLGDVGDVATAGSAASQIPKWISDLLPGLRTAGTVIQGGAGVADIAQGNYPGGLANLIQAGLTYNPATAPFTLPLMLGNFLTGDNLLGEFLQATLFGGRPSMYKAKRGAAQEIGEEGTQQFTSGLQGLDPKDFVGLLQALGAPSADNPWRFTGPERNPIAVDLAVPPELREQLGFPNPMVRTGGGMPYTTYTEEPFLSSPWGGGGNVNPFSGPAVNPWTGMRQVAHQNVSPIEYGPMTAYQFNPQRGGAFQYAPGTQGYGPESRPGQITPQEFASYLGYARTHPEALSWLRGSGDVAYAPQAEAEAFAGRNRAAAQAAIQRLLDTMGVA